jgi:hypothetical protein
MSTEAMDPDPNGDRDKAQDRDNRGGFSAANTAENKGNWEKVEEEYQRVVQALNRSRVSFTSRSAEGITLYGGLDSHNANGNMRKLAEHGHLNLLKRINERKTLADAEAADTPPEMSA